MNKVKILVAAMAFVIVCSTNAFAKSEEWQAFKDCKARVEQGSIEDCSALKPSKMGKNCYCEKGKDCNCHKCNEGKCQKGKGKGKGKK
ncbi:MAG: hypothetical protein LBC85_02790 [Fibromonadaceae bacterium]|jgi:hypothetical protein|nr:hypothetical protein [Fibromonadaceae bacterium]